jgi:nucleotide-binding universal stress UspA family protein
VNRKQPRRVVVGLDFSDAAVAALSQALALPCGGRGGELHVLHVESSPIAPADERDCETAATSLSDSSERLRRQVEHEIDRLGVVTSFERVALHVRVGPPAEAIARLAAEVDADIVVVGSHGAQGVHRPPIGSVAEATVRCAGCPVLVVRPKDHADQVETGFDWEPAAATRH